MPINMDPKKKRLDLFGPKEAEGDDQPTVSSEEFGKETEQDREKALADAEWKNLWDATEVIDMDTF